MNLTGVAGPSKILGHWFRGAGDSETPKPAASACSEDRLEGPQPVKSVLTLGGSSPNCIAARKWLLPRLNFQIRPLPWLTC